MTWGPVDKLDRTAKILIDAGKAADPAQAAAYLQGLILQVAVGPDVEDQPAAQAALATVSTSLGAPIGAAFTSTSKPIRSSIPAGPLG